MRKAISIICFLLPLSVVAQYSSKEIVARRISKMMISSLTDGIPGTQKQEYRYDRNGNDTAYYIGMELSWRSVYVYGPRGQVLKRTRYRSDGTQIETSDYTYSPDSSCKISTADKDLGLTSYEWYDKMGRKIKSQPPDGNLIVYSYNAKGQLVSLRSNAANHGTVIDIQYSYNSKGQLVKELSKGEYKGTKIHSYDAKGLLIKVVDSASDEGEIHKTTDSYEYEFWK